MAQLWEPGGLDPYSGPTWSSEASIGEIGGSQIIYHKKLFYCFFPVDT
jgi:hypothetical protein